MEGQSVRPSRTLSNVFREAFPYYLYLGMSSEEYWHGDAWLPVAYRKAHIMYQDDQNERAWWQGHYNYVAVATALKNGFREKGAKAEPYPKEPFRIREKTEIEKQQEIIAERQRVVDMLTKMKTDYDMKLKAEEENGERTTRHPTDKHSE